MAIGAPHLGAPKALRVVVTGDKMGLDQFMSDNEGLTFSRTLGSSPWLFPLGKLLFQDPEQSYWCLRDEEKGGYRPLATKEAFDLAGCSVCCCQQPRCSTRLIAIPFHAIPCHSIPFHSGNKNCYEWLQKYYMEDPHFGGSFINGLPNPPPIKRVKAIYGTHSRSLTHAYSLSHSLVDYRHQSRYRGVHYGAQGPTHQDRLGLDARHGSERTDALCQRRHRVRDHVDRAAIDQARHWRRGAPRHTSMPPCFVD